MNKHHSEVVSIRMPHEIKDKLNALAKATTRRKSDLLLSWITEKIEQEVWQLKQIEDGLSDAENGRFADKDDLELLAKKWNFNIQN